MKTWGEMDKQEKLKIIEALLDGKRVESFSLGYDHGELVRAWRKTWLNFFYEDIQVRIVE